MVMHCLVSAQGTFPPGKKDNGLAFKVMVNMIRAHAAAYHVIHQIQPEARVGIVNYYRSLDAFQALVSFGRISDKPFDGSK